MFKKIIRHFLSIYSSIFCLFLFAISMAIATFIENDFGTIESKALVYNSFWFECLLFFLTIIFIYNIFKYKIFRLNKLPILFLHFSFIFILIGAGVTRYVSQEGTMPIFEGESSNSFISSDAYLEFEYHDKKSQFIIYPKKLLLSQIKDNTFKISLRDFKGQPINLSYYDFIADDKIKENKLIFKSNSEIIQANMKDPNDQELLLPDNFHSFQKMTPYFINDNAFVLRDIQNKDGKIFLELVTSGKEITFLYDGDYKEKGGLSFSFNNSMEADINISNSSSKESFLKNEQEVIDLLKVRIEYLEYDTIIDLNGAPGIVGDSQTIYLDSLYMKMSYGSREIILPFNIKLNDFEMQRYPGSDSPASYASEVTVIPNKINSDDKSFDYRIFMNNILNYKGYRFFQASYFPDESGTILSVNQDRLGTIITYFGYFMLVLSIFSVLISKRTRFNMLSRRYKATKNVIMFIFFFLFSHQSFSNDLDSVLYQLDRVDIKNSSIFSKVLIEDNNGRIKPFHTLSSELIRKISKKKNISYNYNNQQFQINSNQVLLGMILYPFDWMKIPLIHTGNNDDVKKNLNIKKDLVSYYDFWKPGLKVFFPPTSFNLLDTTIFSSNSPENLSGFDFSFNNNLENHINLSSKNGFMKINAPYIINYLILNGHNEGQKGNISPNETFSFQDKIVFTIIKDQKQIVFIPTIDLSSVNYILKKHVDLAFSKNPTQRNKFDKSIIELDERFNISHIIFNSRLSYRTNPFSKVHLNFFPQELPMFSSDSLIKKIVNEKWTFDKEYKFGETYFNLYKKYIDSDSSNKAVELIKDIISYQKSNASLIIPSEKRINLEILYNKINPFHFSRLLSFYLLFGLFFLVVLIFQIFFSKNRLIKNLIKFFKISIVLGFLFHTISLISRWIISGHAPWSDAYESIIYISWATILSGIIFSKKSNFSLSGASIVGAILLLVANLNWINPEITNLVPVLNSYWLMIHVSVITSSYGFLALSAFIGLLTLFLIIFISRDNFEKINSEIQKLVVINERCMMIGLFLLTIGTFLGGIWANESWGRYWGWDPKETWALISVVVYSIILHIRLISSFRFKYLFSVFSILGFSSIIMTYFGVNFYLSGLHSYAQGDPAPIPNFVPIALTVVLVVSIISYIKYSFFYLKKIKKS